MNSDTELNLSPEATYPTVLSLAVLVSLPKTQVLIILPLQKYKRHRLPKQLRVEDLYWIRCIAEVESMIKASRILKTPEHATHALPAFHRPN